MVEYQVENMPSGNNSAELQNENIIKYWMYRERIKYGKSKGKIYPSLHYTIV